MHGTSSRRLVYKEVSWERWGSTELGSWERCTRVVRSQGGKGVRWKGR